MRRAYLSFALALLVPLSAPAHAGMFEDPLDCTKPRLALARGLCADPQLLALARETQASFDQAKIRLKAHPALLTSVETLNAAFVSSLGVQFDADRMQPLLALKRHKALLDSIEARPGKGIGGAWASDSVDLLVTGQTKLSAKFRSQGFGQNAYDCGWRSRVVRARADWRTDTGPKNADPGVFHVTMKRQQDAGLTIETPEQSERAPDDCPPWAQFSGLLVPVSSKAQIERMPGFVLPQRDSSKEKRKSIEDVLRLLPGRPFAEHAPELTKDILVALIEDKPTEGWSLVRPKPDVIDIAHKERKNLIIFRFTDDDRRSIEMIAYHNGFYHLAEWSERADGTTMFFSVPSLRRAVQRLFYTTRSGFKDGLPRQGLADSDLTDELRSYIDRLQSCRYFGEIRKAGPSLSQSEIDNNRTSSKCGELKNLEDDIRERRAKYPDILRALDLANRLVDE
ncbi:MAG: hypothetical protein CFE31_08220 [Rhizobiales bacterium PAR1]|nr:MAG: hypothetical protein CFE31_08220 [Rhizobiales bacterium PAR1]